MVIKQKPLHGEKMFQVTPQGDGLFYYFYCYLTQAFMDVDKTY